MKPKPYFGQTLYMLNVGNNCRYKPQVLTPVVVSSVGRKYFSVKVSPNDYFETQFKIDNWREHTHYSPDWSLYESEAQFEAEKETGKLRDRMRQEFDHFGWNISLTKLRKIAAILDEKEPNET